MSKKPTVLMILDGYGLNDNCEHNAVCEGKTPIMDQLMSQCPYVEGQASGMAVGLPEGQMGNSEVGHLNMGAGRIVYQELTRITKAIEDGDFFENPELLAAVENAKKNNSALHMFGLLSDGGVHSHITHLFGLLELAKRQGLEKVYVHCFLDGRDTPPASGKEYVEELEAKMKEIGAGDKEKMMVFNKCDLLSEEQREALKHRYDAMLVSAADGFGIDELIERIAHIASAHDSHLEVLIPYNKGNLVSIAHERCRVLTENHTETGTHLTILAPPAFANDFAPYVVERN